MRSLSMHWVSLLGWVTLCLAVAGISGRWTAREVGGWYTTLKRPTFAPPNRMFAPVWTVLYLMMAIAAWSVWELPASPQRSFGVGLFLVQLALNFTWPWLFFRRHLFAAAAAEIVLLWAAIAGTLSVFMGLSLFAGWLLVPYLAWVGFASWLNLAFWWLNRE